jgi:hypothetical protein
MKRDGLLLASLPSSGSDWCARAICASNPTLIYAREYFCPFVNWKDSQRLEQTLGDTLSANTGRLVRGITLPALDSLLEETWRRSGASFTKENYLPYQLETFAERFEVIILLREFCETFPPNRRRVLMWYEHFGVSLQAASHLDMFCCEHMTTPMNRAAIGHYWFTRRYLQAAAIIKCPVLWFGDMLVENAATICDRLGDCSANPDGIAMELVKTRSRSERPIEHLEQWTAATELHDELQRRYGQEHER